MDLGSDFFERLAQPPLSQAPHAVLEPLRREPPPRLRSGEVVVAGHGAVLEILRNPKFERPPLPRVPFGSVRTLFRMFLLLNAPDHARLRRTVAPLFAPAAVERRRVRVNEIATILLEGRREIELIADFAYPLPLTVIAEMLGIPEHERADVAVTAATLTRALDVPPPVTPAALPRFLRAVRDRRARPIATLRAARRIVSIARRHLMAPSSPPDADVLAVLRSAHDDGMISTDEAIATWILIVIAGHETTANLIGNTLHSLLEHPEQLEAVLHDDALVPKAVDETLRYESPVPMTVRMATEDMGIAGTEITAGTQVVALLGAANRDPNVFDAPDRFEIHRDASGHIAFGHGSHFCVGAHLARLEAEVAVGAVLQHHPALVSGQQPRWRDTFATRGLTHLPVRFTT